MRQAAVPNLHFNHVFLTASRPSRNGGWEKGGDKFSIYPVIKEALCEPYATVSDIRDAALPTADEVKGWTSEQFTAALRHQPGNPGYIPDLRQLLHVGFKIAAQLGNTYLDALETNREVVAKDVPTTCSNATSSRCSCDPRISDLTTDLR